MKRNTFLKTLSWTIPAAGLASTPLMHLQGKQIDQAWKQDVLADPKVVQAMLAMLSMQRAAWEQGTASQALIAIQRNDLAILLAKDALVRQTAEGRLGVLGSDPCVTDPGSNGEAVLLAYRETSDEAFRKAAEAQYRYFKETAPRTADGILHHVSYAPQVWSDASFMAPPFLALMGDFEEAVKQIEGYRKYLMSADKKLYSHIWDEGKKDFARKLFWGGGNGWTAAGIAKIINLLPADREDLRIKLVRYGKEVIDGCLAYLRTDGLFHDIIDDSTTFVETNLGQMLAFAIYTAIKAGWIETSYRSAADRMRDAARAKVDFYGIVQGACGSPNFDRVGTSTEAQAFFLMMESAYHRQKEQ